MSHWCNDVAPPECGYTQAGTKQVQTNRRSIGRIGWENKQPDRRRPPRPALAWRRTAGSWTRVASRGGYQVGQPLRLKVQLDQQRERRASTGMHPLNYSESVPGRRPTTGRQAATSRGTSTGMHTVGCSRMCACQQCCTPLPYDKS